MPHLSLWLWKKWLLIASKYPTTPMSTSSLLSYSIDSLWWIGLFRVGADSCMHCWITALSRHNTPPQRQQKGRLLCLARGKHLGTDDAGQADLRSSGYCGNKVLLWWGQQRKWKQGIICNVVTEGEIKNGCILSERHFLKLGTHSAN